MADASEAGIPEEFFLREGISMSDIVWQVRDCYRSHEPVSEHNAVKIFLSICQQLKQTRANWKRLDIVNWSPDARSDVMNMINSGLLANLQELVLEAKHVEGCLKLDISSSLRHLTVSGLSDTKASSEAKALGEYLRSNRANLLESLQLQNDSYTLLEEMITCLGHGQVSKLRKLCLGVPRVDSFSWLINDFRSEVRSALRASLTIRLVQSLKEGGINELRVLKLWGNGFTRNALSTIAQCPQLKMLESLQISGPGCYEDASGRLAWAEQSIQLENLRKLRVGGFNLAQSVIDYLLLWLESGKAFNLVLIKLWHFDFEFVPDFVTQDLVKIAKALEMQKLPSLQEFSLFTERDVGQEVERAFLNAYQQNRFLTAKVFDGLNFYRNVTKFHKTLDQYRKLNEKYVELKKALGDEPNVPGTYGKVFLCGSARMGKTTLRRTLTKEKSFWKLFSSLCEICSRSKHEPSTRGIEVDRMLIAAKDSQNPKLELGVWDLAGQSEYEVLHSAFLPDLALADGQATCFVIVCSANADQGSNPETAQKSLLYWLKFIASNSSQRRTQLRRVLVVLNCFYGARWGHDAGTWKYILDTFQERFQDYLNLHPEPFIINVQIEEQVSSLKEHIEREARDCLQKMEVPKICADVLERCRTWAAGHREYPIVSWEEYQRRINQLGWSFEKFQAATTYLHEAGHLIWFKKLGGSRLSQPEDQAVLVLDPEWLCKPVVGELLLPDFLLNPDETSLASLHMEERGALRLAVVAKERFEIPDEKCEEMVQILERLGLGYVLPDDDQNIFIPALIKDDKIPDWFTAPSESVACWVTGFSLAAKDSEMTLLPVVILRNLQVSLALDKEKGRQPDSDFKAGISRISFKCKQVGVLVEYYRDPDTRHNRLDILVKPMVSPLSNDDARLHRQKQVNLAEEIMHQTLTIASKCCPGLGLETLVMKPWGCAEAFVRLQDRDVAFSMEEMVTRMQDEINSSLKGGDKEVVLATSWVIGGELVEYRDVLGEKELEKVASAFEEKSMYTEYALKHLGLMPGKEPRGVEEDAHVQLNGESSKERSTDDPIQQLVCEISELKRELKLEVTSLKSEMHQRFDQMDSQIKGMTPKLEKVIKLQTALNRYVHSLVTFTVEEKETPVPRFLYVTENHEKKWVLQNIYSQRASLHFLCEARHGDLNLHQVEGQLGVGILYTKEWAEKLAPVLNWTFKIAVVGVKVVDSILLPGLNFLFPDFEVKAVKDVTQLMGGIADLISETGFGSKGKNAPPAYTTQAQEARRDALQYVQENVVGKLSDKQFEQEVGLWRVRIEDAQGNTRRVGWICGACRKKYGKLAKPMPVNIK